MKVSREEEGRDKKRWDGGRTELVGGKEGGVKDEGK